MEAPERRPAEGLGEVGTRDREPWSRDGSRKRDGDGGEAADTERHRNKRGRGESRKGGRRARERGARMKGAAAGSARRRESGEQGGEAAGREQRSRGGPAPRDSAAATLGPYHEVSPALGLRENKWCPR